MLKVEMADSSAVNWNREWGTYLVKAVFAEKPEEGIVWPEISREDISSHKNSCRADWEAHFFQLPNPIFVTGLVEDIFSVTFGGKKCRVYPPFPVNEVKEVAGAFTDITIPQGQHKVSTQVSIPDSAVKGASAAPGQSDETKHCRGIRFDSESGHNDETLLKSLLDQITQYTHQWWLRSPQSPFKGPFRLGCAINQDFELMTELKHRGAGDIESTWYAARSLQTPLGFERPLSKGLWLLCLHNVQNSIPADTGLLEQV